MNKCLTTCRECCKFKKDELYFATKVTRKEIIKLKSSGSYKNVFSPFKNSRNVFQIKMIKSKFSKEMFVCPYLDEDTQECKIYTIRPFDCKFWPFLLMHDKKKEKILIVHINKEICQITGTMSKTQFKYYLNKSLARWIREENLIKLISEYPELVWDYEPETFILKEVKHDRATPQDIRTCKPRKRIALCTVKHKISS